MGLAALVKEEDTVNEELKDSTYLGYCVWKHASQPHRGLDIMIFYLSPSSDPVSTFTELLKRGHPGPRRPTSFISQMLSPRHLWVLLSEQKTYPNIK